MLSGCLHLVVTSGVAAPTTMMTDAVDRAVYDGYNFAKEKMRGDESMKKITVAAVGLVLAMLLSACGSGNIADAPDPSSSVGVMDADSKPSADVKEPASPAEDADPTSSVSGSSDGTSSSKPSTGSSGSSSSKPGTTPKPTPKPTPAPTPKPTPKPTPAPTPRPTPTPQKSIWQWPISASDRDAIYAELVAYGQSLGLRHLAVDDGIVKTPDNSSWAAPTTINQSSNPNFVQIGLKNDIKYLPQMVEDYGGGKIDYFIVYVEDLGGGNCKIYIMY